MPNYKKMYFQLSASVADAVDILIKAQQQGENDYIEGESPLVELADRGPEKEGGDGP